MLKAVFFDLYHTLVGYDPPREKLQAEALKKFGINATVDDMRRPIAVADEFIYREMALMPFNRRSKEEQSALWAHYERVFLREAGIEPQDALIRFLLEQMGKTKLNVVPFADAIPTLTDLGNRGILRGLISNIDSDIAPLLSKAGLSPLLTVVVTSQDAGASKPNPEIFLRALRKADVQPAESLYVGDQYQVDIVGAQKAGMKGILIDRHDFYAAVTDCPRIHALSELSALLET